MFPVKQWAQDQLLWAERLTDSNLWSISSLETGLCVQLDFLPLNNCQPGGQWVLGSLVSAEGAWKVYNLRGLPPGIQKNLPEQQMAWVKPENHVFLLNIWSMLAYMEDSALQAFLLDVLSDDQIMLLFCTASASRSYHHNQQGGLLAHSCQVAMCAAMMCTQLHMGRRAAWVAFLGGLFHDLGKTWMFYNEEQGLGGQHESYSLILLASPLQKLRQQSPQLFEALTIAEAKQDRADIADYIAVENPRAALKMDDLFSDAANKLAEFPKLGRIGKVPGTRELIPHESYRLVYEVDKATDTVWVMSLVHTARMWPPVS